MAVMGFFVSIHCHSAKFQNPLIVSHPAGRPLSFPHSPHLHKLPRLPAHRAALVDLRADLFVITSVANRKTTRTVGTTIESHTIADPARRYRARLAETHSTSAAAAGTAHHNGKKQSGKQNENRFQFHHRLVLTSIRSANKLKNFVKMPKILVHIGPFVKIS